MIIERKEDLILVEVDSKIEKMIEKYYKAFLDDRVGEVENAEEIYSQEGRQPAGVGGEIQFNGQPTTGS